MIKVVSNREICFVKAVQTLALFTKFRDAWFILPPPHPPPIILGLNNIYKTNIKKNRVRHIVTQVFCSSMAKFLHRNQNGQIQII